MTNTWSTPGNCTVLLKSGTQRCSDPRGTYKGSHVKPFKCNICFLSYISFLYYLLSLYWPCWYPLPTRVLDILGFSKSGVIPCRDPIFNNVGSFTWNPVSFGLLYQRDRSLGGKTLVFHWHTKVSFTPGPRLVTFSPHNEVRSPVLRAHRSLPTLLS